MKTLLLLVLLLLSFQLFGQVKHIELSLLHGYSANSSSKYWGKFNTGKQIGLGFQTKVFRSFSVQVRSRYKELAFYRVDWKKEMEPDRINRLELVGVINRFNMVDFSVLVAYPIIEKDSYSINVNIGRGFSSLLNNPELNYRYRFQGLVDQFNFFEMGFDLRYKINNHIYYALNLQYNYMSLYKDYYWANISYQFNSMITYRFDRFHT